MPECPTHGTFFEVQRFQQFLEECLAVLSEVGPYSLDHLWYVKVRFLLRVELWPTAMGNPVGVLSEAQGDTPALQTIRAQPAPVHLTGTDQLIEHIGMIVRYPCRQDLSLKRRLDGLCSLELLDDLT